MKGPYSAGTHDYGVPPTQRDWEFGRLERGHRYRVVKAFVDADGDRHDVGEEWVFVTQMFSKLDDELTICVRSESNEEWRIPMSWKPDAQQDTIEGFRHYVKEA